MHTVHRCLLPAVLALAGSAAVVGDLVFTPHDRSVWDEFGFSLLTFGLVGMSYQLSRR